MSFFKGYLKERWKRLLMLLLFVCIFAFSFWVYRLPVRAVMYPCALCLRRDGVRYPRIVLNDKEPVHTAPPKTVS